MCSTLLRPGDILTHAFTGLTERLVDERGDGQGRGAAMPASVGVIARHRPRLGIVLVRCAEALAAAGFWPDTISTDLHQVSLPGPNLLDPLAIRTSSPASPGDGTPGVHAAHGHVQVPAPGHAAARTSSRRRRRGPPRVLGLAAGGGTLAVGRAWPTSRSCAWSTARFELYDIHGERRTADRLIEHEATILGGRVMEPGPMPEAPPWIRLVDREPAA